MNFKAIIKYFLPYGLVLFLRKRREAAAVRLLRDTHWRKPVRKNDECIVLAGGPSVREIWQDIVKIADQVDIFTVNWSLRNADVRALRPMGHAMIDPAFFMPESYPQDSPLRGVPNSAFEMLSLVDWPLILYVFSHQYDAAVSLGYTKNPNITLVALPCPCPLPERFSEKELFDLMDEGVVGAGSMNVPVVLLCNAVTARYKKVGLAGLDLTFIRDFSVDEHNRAIYRSGHFYENNMDEYIDSLSIGGGLLNSSNACFEYYLVRRYADSRNVPIVNLSLASLCDAFQKGTFGGDVYEDMRLKN